MTENVSVESKKLVSLVIPFHNEHQSLPTLLSEIQEHLDESAFEYEVLLVNDCSTDTGPKIVTDFAETHARFRLLELETRGGQTGAFAYAFEIAKGDYIIRMDADLQDDPRDLPLFEGMLLDGSELVVGLRANRKHSRAIRLITAIFDIIVLTFIHSPLHTHSGSFVAFKSSLVQNIPWRNNDHRYLPLIALRRGANKPREVIVNHRHRRFGTSHYKIARKFLLGIPEVLMFLLRIVMGYYDLKPKT